MRIVRLILSIWILIMALPASDWLMAIFGAFFLYTALMGLGCCGVGGCYIQPNKKSLKDIKELDYQKIE